MAVWEEESYTRKDENGNHVSVEEYEATHQPTGFGKIMTRNDVKLYFICGVGFMIDAYDLFIINSVTPLWTYEYWGGLTGVAKPTYPLLLRGAVNAAANIGNVIGQILFGFLGDAFGRKFVYGKELIIAIIGIILVISLPNYIQPTYEKFWYLFGFRLLMGIGIGGDYPMSAAIVAERSTLANRGRMLGWIFSNQGWGTLAASIVTLILLGIFKTALTGGAYGQLDAIWRCQIGFALVPAFAVLYFRLTMPEGRKFLQSQELTTVQASSLMASRSTLDSVEAEKANIKEANATEEAVEAHAAPPSNSQNFQVFFKYFSEWRHLRTLIGTASCWFLVDVAFYGLNLNQSVLLAAIGYSSTTVTGVAKEYYTLVKGAEGNLIIAVAGYVPGYFITIATIEFLGRRWIQIQGFLVTALMFIIIAADYGTVSSTGTISGGIGTGGKFACFVIAQLFFNFGPNATTFIVPAEVFPSRVRGLAHGISAAVGKLGAILSGVLFNYLASGSFGVANTLWIFVGCSLAGAIMTFLFVPESAGIDADAVDYEEIQEEVRRKQLGIHTPRQDNWVKSTLFAKPPFLSRR